MRVRRLAAQRSGERTRPAVSAPQWRLGPRRGTGHAPAAARAGIRHRDRRHLDRRLGTFAVVHTVVHKILLERMPHKDPDDYFVWRDYRAYFDLDRGWLGGTDVAELQKAGGAIEDAVGLLRQSAIFAVREGTPPTEIGVMITSPNLFDVLGVQPALGRGFAQRSRTESSASDRPDARVVEPTGGAIRQSSGRLCD